MPRQISIAMSGEQRHIYVRLCNEICVHRDTWQIEPAIIWILLLHQKISTSMLGKNNTFPSKHGMGGPRWMQNWISKFKCKIFLNDLGSMSKIYRNRWVHPSFPIWLISSGQRKIKQTAAWAVGPMCSRPRKSHKYAPKPVSQNQQCGCRSNYSSWRSTTTLGTCPVFRI